MRLRRVVKISTVLLCAAWFSSCSNPLGSRSQISSTFHPGLDYPPAISSVSPSSGPLQGGTAITILGLNFTNGVSVNIGSTSCQSVVVVSGTEITCVTPPGTSGAVNVSISETGYPIAIDSGGFEYLNVNQSRPGWGLASGGGFSSGSGMMLRGTAGTIGNPVVATGTGVSLRGGIQGVLPQ
jgi:hypothetical protein